MHEKLRQDGTDLTAWSTRECIFEMTDDRNRDFQNCQEVAKERRMLGSENHVVLMCLQGKLGVVDPGIEMPERI